MIEQLAVPQEPHQSGPGRFRIACIVPAYNEEKFIAAVAAGIPDFVDAVVVVNDCSTDATAAVVEGLADPRIVLVNHERNTGVGGAMLSGYQKALQIGADVAVKVDGDGQMDPRDMRRLIAPVLRGEADYAKGVRFRDSAVLREMPAVRLIGNLGLSFLTKAASGYWNIFDPTNGYTALGRVAMEHLNFQSLARGYFFETSMLINLNRIDAVVVDVPMKARYGAEHSKLSPGRVLVSFPGYLLKAFVKRIAWRYFIRGFSAASAFIIVGSLLFGFGFCHGAWHWIASYRSGVTTPAGTVMLAAVPLILGFQLLLQAMVLDIQNSPATPLQRGAEAD